MSTSPSREKSMRGEELREVVERHLKAKEVGGEMEGYCWACNRYNMRSVPYCTRRTKSSIRLRSPMVLFAHGSVD